MNTTLFFEHTGFPLNESVNRKLLPIRGVFPDDGTRGI